MKKIGYGKQFIDSDDERYLKRIIYDDLITNGKQVQIFEKKLKQKLKSKFCLVCNSATSGLFLAFRAINIKKNDIIVMPAINFISSYSMAKQVGAKIFLCDVDKETGQITPDTFKKCLKINKIKKLKALVTMYLGGYPNNINEFFKLKKKYKFFLIEDSCHALGGSYKIGKKYFPIGSNRHSDISIFSFHPVKPITTGEGGAITTNNSKIFQKIQLLRNHGIVRKSKYWDYDIKELSFNFRISDLNCALGITQLKKINKFIKKRNEIYKWYNEYFGNLKNIKLIKVQKNTRSSYHLILLNINFDQFNIDKDIFLKKLNKKNIFLQFHYKPIFLFSFFKQKKNYLKNSIKYMSNTVSLPVFHELRKKDIDNISKIIFSVLKKPF